MHSKKIEKFQGQIETVFQEAISDIDIKVRKLFKKLRIMSHLTAAGIRKLEGYPACHLLYVLVNLVFLHIKGIGDFSQRNLMTLSEAQKDAFYRFKNRDYSWRSFHWRLVCYMAVLLKWNKQKKNQSYFVLDATCLPKRGQKIEEVSYVYDPGRGKSVPGFELLTLLLVNAQSYYPLDFGYHFSKDKGKHYRPARPDHPTSGLARRLKEAKISKLDLSLQMLKRALAKGIKAGYVLFDRWFTSPKFLKALRALRLHGIGRLKQDATLYCYKGRSFTLKELYKRIKSDLVLDKELGYQLARAEVVCSNGLAGVIIFSKGYQEPELEKLPGAKLTPQPKWAAFFSTDASLAAGEVVKKFMSRWSIEVFFKEAKTRLGLGKDQSRAFAAQVCSITLTFLRYNLLAFLQSHNDSHLTIGGIFRELESEMGILTHHQKIISFFRQFVLKTLEIINQFRDATDNFQDYIDIIINYFNSIHLCQGCET